MPSQQKQPMTDQNGVSVIQSQTLSSATMQPGAGLQQVPQLVPVSSGGGGKAAPPSGRLKKNSGGGGGGGGGGGSMDKGVCESDEYRQRRERNNLAVKKSRMRSKQKAADTQQRVNELKEENERLEAKIKLLSKELSVLKDLFLEHAHNLADAPPPHGAPPTGPVAVETCVQTSHNNNNNNNNIKGSGAGP